MDKKKSPKEYGKAEIIFVEITETLLTLALFVAFVAALAAGLWLVVAILEAVSHAL